MHPCHAMYIQYLLVICLYVAKNFILDSSRWKCILNVWNKFGNNILIYTFVSLPATHHSSNKGTMYCIWLLWIFRIFSHTGCFFNCSFSFSLPKWGTKTCQRGVFVLIENDLKNVSGWLELMFHFRTDNWAEQWKKPCMDYIWALSKECWL